MTAMEKDQEQIEVPLSRDALRALVPARALFPDLEPADVAPPPPEPLETEDFRSRPERESPVARLTVYTLNATVMVFAFPVGIALLVFNLLGGENLRTTAHALALTGVFLGIASTDQGELLLSAFAASNLIQGV